MKAIIAEGIHKSFKEAKALNGVDLSINKGDIYGLVGPDGAGKTTLIRILVGIMSADKGSITVLGKDVRKNPDSIKHLIGYMSQKFSLYGDLSVKENMEFYADLFELTEKERKDRTKRLLEFSHLSPFLDRRAEALSGGMKQKLGLSCALLHTPEILFLDEPTTGVDPVSRRELWMILYDLWKEGMTIFLSTPYLDEAERCTKIGFINRGRIIAEDSPEEIKNKAGFSVISLLLEDIVHTRQKLDDNSSEIPPYNLFGHNLHFISNNYSKDKHIIEKYMKSLKISFSKIEEIQPGLEDIFLYLTADKR
jgi:ABC-2 type transport system ATP-binding protein